MPRWAAEYRLGKAGFFANTIDTRYAVFASFAGRRHLQHKLTSFMGVNQGGRGARSPEFVLGDGNDVRPQNSTL